MGVEGGRGTASFDARVSCCGLGVSLSGSAASFCGINLSQRDTIPFPRPVAFQRSLVWLVLEATSSPGCGPTQTPYGAWWWTALTVHYEEFLCISCFQKCLLYKIVDLLILVINGLLTNNMSCKFYFTFSIHYYYYITSVERGNNVMFVY